jgi:hypothetical protein
VLQLLLLSLLVAVTGRRIVKGPVQNNYQVTEVNKNINLLTLPIAIVRIDGGGGVGR